MLGKRKPADTSSGLAFFVSRVKNMASSQRLAAIDGLKGIAGVLIVAAHYLYTFAPFGKIGWGTGVTTENAAAVYMKYYPYSALLDFSPLPIFYTVIAFIPALKFFQDGDDEFLRKQALLRYFRLAPLTITCAVFSYALFALGLSHHIDVYELLNNNWIKASAYTDATSFSGAVWNGLFEVFVDSNKSGYCNVLWCMPFILTGSYFTYAVLLIFGRMKHRALIYAALYGLCFFAPPCTVFLAGVAAADIYAHQKTHDNPKTAAFCGFMLLLGVFFPTIRYPAGVPEYMVTAFIMLFLLGACLQSDAVRRALSARCLTQAGKRSFCLVLAHFPIMTSFSCWEFAALHNTGVSYGVNLTLTFVCAVPCIWAATEAFYRLVEIPTAKATAKIYAYFRA